MGWWSPRTRIVRPSCSRGVWGLRYIGDAMVWVMEKNEGGGGRATRGAFAGDSGSARSWSSRAELRIGHATRRRGEEDGEPRAGSSHEVGIDVGEPTLVARPGQDARVLSAAVP